MAARRAFISLFPSVSILSCSEIPVQSISRGNRPSICLVDEAHRPICINCGFGALTVGNRRNNLMASWNRSLSTVTTPISSSHTSNLSGFWNLMQRYEDVIGLTDVKNAQKSVLQAERDFERMQEVRRGHQDQIQHIQLQLKEIHAELDKTSRGEDRYIDLLTREHAIIKQEKTLLDEFKRLERSERSCFNVLSTRLRESHEKERERAERTKYWSIIGSAIGALMGIIGATVNNRLRLKELRDMVERGSEPGRVQSVVGQLSDVVRLQQQHVAAFVADLKTMLNNSRSQLSSATATTLVHRTATSSSTESDQWSSPLQSSQILTAIQDQDKKMSGEMQEIKKMIAAEHGYSMQQDGTIVYVGPEMQALLEQTEKNIDFKLKMNTLVAVVALYGALALTLPLFYAIFKGT